MTEETLESIDETHTSAPPTPAITPLSTGSIDAWSIKGSDLDEMEFEPVKMVVPGLLPAGLAILAGKPKSGKSLLTLQMGLAVAEGTLFLGEAMPQGDVLLFAMEDDLRRLKTRSLALTEGDPLPDRFRMFIPKSRDIKLPDIEELIEEWAAQVDAPSVVIIDTMVKVMPRKQAGQDDYSHNTQVLGRLQALALRLDIAVLIVHHESKRSDNVDEFDAMLGSTGINGTADTLMLLKRSRGMASGELSITGRDLPEQMSIPLELDGLFWRKSGIKNYRDLLNVSPLQLKALQAVAAHLADGSPTCKAGAIVSALGRSSSQTSNVLKDLKSKGFLENPSYGSYALAPGVAEKLSMLREGAEIPPPASVLDVDPIPDATTEFEIDFGF